MTKNIIIIAKCIDGGTGHFVSQLSKIKHEFNIKFLVLERPKYRSVNIDNTEFLWNSNHYSEKYSLSIKQIFFLVKEYLWITKLVTSAKPQIILTVDSHAFIIIALYRLFNHSFYFIATIHNNLPAVIGYKVPRAFRFLTKKILKTFFKKIDIVITPSKMLSHAIRSYFNLTNNPTTIPYCLDDKYCKSTITTRKLKTGNLTLLFIGRFTAQKDIITVIEAYEMVKKLNRKLKLSLVGDGPLKKEIEEYVINNSLESISFKSWSNNPISLYKQADILLFSSNWEGFGQVIIEAMSQGLPIISTNTSYGPKEILKNNIYGKLIPVGSARLMAKSIYELSTSSKVYEHYSYQSIFRASKYCSNGMTNKYGQIFNYLINEKDL